MFLLLGVGFEVLKMSLHHHNLMHTYLAHTLKKCIFKLNQQMSLKLNIALCAINSIESFNEIIRQCYHCSVFSRQYLYVYVHLTGIGN